MQKPSPLIDTGDKRHYLSVGHFMYVAMLPIVEFATSFNGAYYTRLSRQVGLRDIRNCKVALPIYVEPVQLQCEPEAGTARLNAQASIFLICSAMVMESGTVLLTMAIRSCWVMGR